MNTDACDYQVNFVLIKEQEDKVIPSIDYWSRSLTEAEKNNTKKEKECLAILWAFSTLRPYLNGQRFTVLTNYESSRWVLSLADSNGRLQRWCLRLLDFDFEVVHRAGIKHQAADALSRMRTKGAD